MLRVAAQQRKQRALHAKSALFQFTLPSAEAKSSIAGPFTAPESRKKTAL
jgi:hypothetical protein